MRLFSKAKDGGPKSTVTGYWLIEWKRLFSVVLLRFDDGSREEYHDHAFDSLNWVLRGRVIENILVDGDPLHEIQVTRSPSVFPIITRRRRMHRVVSRGTTWVFSLRGPWRDSWTEYDPKRKRHTRLTHGRREIGA